MSGRGIGLERTIGLGEAVGAFYFLFKSAVSKELRISNMHKIL